jgi:flagellar hook protein FlgE
MGILNSFNIGVSGLKATGDGMAVIGDNIANAGTNGFKRSRAEFQDVLSRSLKGIDGGDQIGAGTKMAHVTPVYTQGVTQRTENVTDLALNGDGFFQVDAPFGKGYSRDGTFHFNRDGELVNSDGYSVLGYEADAEGGIRNSIGKIKLGTPVIPATATKEIKFTMNLDSRDEVKQFDITKPEKSSNFNTGVTVYDNVGTARLVTVYFNKTADNTWTYHAAIPSEEAAGNLPPGTMVEMATGTVQFNNKGVLQTETVANNAFNFNKGAAQGQKIDFDFGKSITEGGDGLGATTQYGSESTVSRHTQNGASAASIASMSFSDKGILSAVYSNGEVRDIAQMAIAKFPSNEGLFKVGKNLLKETRKSGEAALGKPGQGGRGAILAKSVELSNVDIASEFVDLMTAQRNFQANTRTITTTDQMLQEVLNIKR